MQAVLHTEQFVWLWWYSWGNRLLQTNDNIESLWYWISQPKTNGPTRNSKSPYKSCVSVQVTSIVTKCTRNTVIELILCLESSVCCYFCFFCHKFCFSLFSPSCLIILLPVTIWKHYKLCEGFSRVACIHSLKSLHFSTLRVLCYLCHACLSLVLYFEWISSYSIVLMSLVCFS